MLADKATLTKILTNHVVGRQARARTSSPATTRRSAGTTITVEGYGRGLHRRHENANVVCGNVQTANATVYIVDSVLMPRRC